MAVFGQPLDLIVGWIAIAFLIIGILVIVKSLPKIATRSGRIVAGAGAGLVVFMIVTVGIFGVPSLPGASISVTPPGGQGGWQVCVTNAKYASIGIGTCVATLNALFTETKCSCTNTTKLGFQNAVRAYFNLTLTPPPGSNVQAFNIIASLSPPPSVTNTSNPSATGPSLALTGSGQYDVTITPSGGTATVQLVIVPVTPGTAKTIAYQVHYAPLLGQLALTQYPFGLTFTFTLVDQASGATIGTVTLTTTIN